jgi:plastocyanin
MGSLSPIRRAAALLPVLVAAGLAGCGGGGGADAATEAATGSAEAGARTVKISDFAYAPPDLTVAAGTTVDFVNEDETAHTATSKGSEAFDSGAIQPGKNAKVTLDQTGTFTYTCAFHPFMKGTITVE